MKDTVILYHGSCLDGFGAAFAAYKKFGDAASYIAVYHNDAPPQGLEGKEVYILDFSYLKPVLLELEKKTKKLVVLDHHSGTQEAVEAVREHIFDNDRSGSGIAWGYFHPEVPLPRLLAYIQDNDLWRHSLPHHQEAGAYLTTAEFTFEEFEKLLTEFADDATFAKMLERGAIYGDYFGYVCRWILKQAQEVQFDDYKILAVNAPRLFRSEVGNLLAKQKGPFSIVWYPNQGKWHYSMRGDGSVDLAKLAEKYGGNGHHNAASFRRPMSEPFLFTPVQK